MRQVVGRPILADMFFFFQAEDGIRDYKVTGVQTCALPIWGRHWLDVARYGEDDFSGTGVIPYANAWRYRDWVVQALNQDMPYDRFLMAQLAGDRMNDPSLLPATGLLGLGPCYDGIAQAAQSRADERHDRVDMVTRGDRKSVV